MSQVSNILIPSQSRLKLILTVLACLITWHRVSWQMSLTRKNVWTLSLVSAYHSSFHFVDGVEVEFLYTAVDALNHVVGLGVVVQHHQTGQLTMQVLAQTVAHPCQHQCNQHLFILTHGKHKQRKDNKTASAHLERDRKGYITDTNIHLKSIGQHETCRSTNTRISIDYSDRQK